MTTSDVMDAPVSFEWTTPVIDRLHKLWRDGWKIAHIAEDIGATAQVVFDKVLSLKLPQRFRSTEQQTLPVESIIVGERFRKDLGDIKDLAYGIVDAGLLHPIAIRPDNMLIAGHRRLEAFKYLGYKEIAVHVVPLDDIMRGEFAENTQRKQFLPSEIDAIRRAMEPMEREKARERQAEAGPSEGRGAKATGSGNFPEAVTGRVRDHIGTYVGTSGRTIDKIKAVMEAAEREPEQYGMLVREMDDTGTVDSAYRKLRQQEKPKPATNDLLLSEEGEEEPKTGTPGNRIKLPQGMTPEELGQLVIDQSDGPDKLSLAQIADSVGVDPKSLSKARDIVLISQREDLSSSEKALALEALRSFNETARCKKPYEMIESIAHRLWGNGSSRVGGNRTKAEERRLDQFYRAFNTIVGACSIVPKLEIPHLPPEKVSKCLREIDASIKHLKSLSRSIQSTRE